MENLLKGLESLGESVFEFLKSVKFLWLFLWKLLWFLHVNFHNALHFIQIFHSLIPRSIFLVCHTYSPWDCFKFKAWCIWYHRFRSSSFLIAANAYKILSEFFFFVYFLAQHFDASQMIWLTRHHWHIVCVMCIWVTRFLCMYFILRKMPPHTDFVFPISTLR